MTAISGGNKNNPQKLHDMTLTRLKQSTYHKSEEHSCCVYKRVKLGLTQTLRKEMITWHIVGVPGEFSCLKMSECCHLAVKLDFRNDISLIGFQANLTYRSYPPAPEY